MLCGNISFNDIQLIIKIRITFVMMNIAFEAKRVFENTTGLGNATRGIVQALATHYPNHQYHLFAPKLTTLFATHLFANVLVHAPNFLAGKLVKPWWRSMGVVRQLVANNIDIYIGLAGELPAGLHKQNIASIVFVHDVIFERYPGQYNAIDVYTYRKKTKYACLHATAIVTNSQQTKQDLIDYYNVPSAKITVVFLSCDTQYYQHHTSTAIEIVKQKYGLPSQYFLSVGSIIERKGLLKICEAQLIQNQYAIPLVIIGNGSNQYADSITAFITKYNLQQKIIFLNQHSLAHHHDFTSSKDFPAIYQGATALVYPSVFEGFGLPVLEAMASGVPVITSNSSCLPEVGGHAVRYVNPTDNNEIATAMQAVLTNVPLRISLIQKGKVQAQKFSEKKLGDRLMNVVMEVMGKND